MDDKILSLLEKIDKKIDANDKKIDALTSRIGAIEDYLKTETITKAEGMRMVETLEGISEAFAQQAAVKAEDKAEATYEMLSSLIEGTTKRIMDYVDYRINELSNTNGEYKAEIIDTIKPVNEVLNLLVKKDEQQDDLIGAIEQRLRLQEETTFRIKRSLKEIEKRLGEN